MKKFTILLATIATLFGTSLFTSCSEPESNEPTIVGTWELTETEDDATAVVTFVFNADGSGSVTQKYTEGSASSQMSEKFEYIYNTDTRELSFISDVEDSDIFSDDFKFEAIITVNKLRLVVYYYSYNEWEKTSDMTLTRVK